MSTKCQTRWSNNYNCFQQCCFQCVSIFCLCACVCMRVCLWMNLKHSERPLAGVRSNERDGNKMLWHPLHVSWVALESPSPIFIPSSHTNQPLQYWLFMLAEGQRDACCCVSALHKNTHTHTFLMLKCANPHFAIKLVSDTELFAGCYVYVFACDVFINVYPPLSGGFEVPHFC